VSPLGQLRVVIEELVALQFEKRLRDPQLPYIRHRVGNVIELRGIVDRPEEARQIVEEGVVASADKDVDVMSARRLHAYTLVGRNGGRKASAGKIDEPKAGSIVVIDRDPNLRGPQYLEILFFNPFQIGQQTGEAGIISAHPRDPMVGRDQYSVQHVGVEYTGLRHGSEG
jgi:hypothetical protein